ncbi:histidine kinase [Microbacterium radiodurans]|uniref:histidine kinase n=2 Tax=Microbacterium radiodurans TaxID=661398 RepID=A0A5J5IS70_9MICO|nr:histidine kinase [Microbacterium radiodurans]
MWGLWMLVRPGREPIAAVVFVAASALTVGSAVVLLIRYRSDGDLGDADRPARWRRFLSWPVVAGLVGSISLGVAAASALLGAATFATVLCLVRWGPGLRWRGVILVEVILAALWFAERPRYEIPEIGGSFAVMFAVFGGMLPLMIALSLWSWDVVLELNRARATEARLAATQERLRLAAELHDLQGHHLQVIALQLELAERMLARDPDAAADQIRLARSSVDEARAGTRELAGRFRGVPLPDELANAADLLRAAGLRVSLDVTAEAADAPADTLGPVVRECTTNVLKHGGGVWAELSLRRDRGFWHLGVANDPGAVSTLGRGAGLEGIAHRVGAGGGDVQTHRGPDRFAVTVSVPAVPGVPGVPAVPGVPGREGGASGRNGAAIPARSATFTAPRPADEGMPR